MKKLTTILILNLFIGLFLLSCDSPLSDIEINNPSLINGAFIIEWVIEDGNESKSATAILTDKNLGLIHLKNGSVKLNNNNLGYQDFINIYYSEINVELNTQYTFTIELANDEEYSSSVTTPANHFGTVSIPNEIDVNSDLQLSWSDFNANQNIKLIYQVQDQLNSNWHNVFERTITDVGSNTISNSNMVYPNPKTDFSKARVKMERTTKGTINSNLRSGTIVSSFVYSKSINIVN